MEQKDIKKMQNNKGITLVALVVTIIVLTILASISIGAVFSEKGIIQQAKDSKKQHEDALAAEERNLNNLLGEYNNSMSGNSFTGGGETTPTPEPTPSVPTGPNGNQLVSSITDTNHSTIEAEDDNGNKVVVPGGFKIAVDSGTTVKQGIVIEDSAGNQFVWIPVSNINHDGSNKIKVNSPDETGVEITLGRYLFNKTTAVVQDQQYGFEYNNPVNIDGCQELATPRESGGSKENTTAKNLKGFIDSVAVNKGYYIGRYEASQGSGDTFGVGSSSSYYKPKSVKSVVWINITQPEAAKASRNMYYGNDYVESDLVNSYMWDTAIIYIQEMGNSKYSIKKASNTKLANTGSTSSDEKCHIFDMAENCAEWDTEYDTKAEQYSSGYGCVPRGANYAYNTTMYTAYRSIGTADSKDNCRSFRVGLYIK